MLRDLFLNGVAFRPFFAPDDAAGAAAAELPLGDPATPPAPAAAAAADPANPDAGAEPSEWDKAPDWTKKQINRQHGKIKTLEQRVAEVEAENRRLQELAEAQRRAAPADTAAPAPSPAAPAAVPQPTPRPAAPAAISDDDPVVLRKAQELDTARQYQRGLVELNAKGEEAYGAKWPKVLEDIKSFGGFDQFTLEQIMTTDNPHKVLFELGSKPELYQRVIDPTLSPAKRLTEFVKIATTQAPTPKAKEPSGAPIPVETVGGRGGAAPEGDVYDPKLASDEKDPDWYRIRAEQKRNSRGRPWSPPLRPSA
jgi:hypothetical protein